MLKTALELLSEFYITLWGQLDDLSDEHRWVKLVGKLKAQRTAAAILSELQGLTLLRRQIDLAGLQKDLDELTQFVDKFKKEWPKASIAERDGLSKSLEEKRAVFQEKGLAFVACQTSVKPREKVARA